MTHKHYILTLSCQDTHGIVAAVSGFLAEHGANILQAQQYGDEEGGRFFMRVAFEGSEILPDRAAITKKFTPIAEQFAMVWDIHNTGRKPRVLVMVSKEGHCLNQLLYRYESGGLDVEIPAIVSNHTTLQSMAERHGITFHHLPVDQDNKKEQEEKLLTLVETLEVDVVVLARYMQILSNHLSEQLVGRCINIHHSFLPGFKGANPYRQAYDRGVKIIGATAHYVTAELDEGPIIEQEVIRVDHTHKPEDLKQLGQDIESRVLFHALKYHIEHRIVLNGNKTVVFR